MENRHRRSSSYSCGHWNFGLRLDFAALKIYIHHTHLARTIMLSLQDIFEQGQPPLNKKGPLTMHSSPIHYPPGSPSPACVPLHKKVRNQRNNYLQNETLKASPYLLSPLTSLFSTHSPLPFQPSPIPFRASDIFLYSSLLIISATVRELADCSITMASAPAEDIELSEQRPRKRAKYTTIAW